MGNCDTWVSPVPLPPKSDVPFGGNRMHTRVSVVSRSELARMYRRPSGLPYPDYPSKSGARGSSSATSDCREMSLLPRFAAVSPFVLFFSILYITYPLTRSSQDSDHTPPSEPTRHHLNGPYKSL